jgi:Raf kinase inhibitor-like YbhB/YbcL family protein
MAALRKRLGPFLPAGCVNAATVGNWRMFAGVGVFRITAGSLATKCSLRLMSSERRDGGSVPQENVYNGSGCGGANISPEFHWSDAPSGTKSFAITIFDPDAPTPGGWWHWIIFNIPATVLELPAGAGNKESRRLPPGAVQCRNDYGEPGYGGPCPPPGSNHRNFVRAYALNVEKLPFGSETPPGKMAARFFGVRLCRADRCCRFARSISSHCRDCAQDRFGTRKVMLTPSPQIDSHSRRRSNDVGPMAHDSHPEAGNGFVRLRPRRFERWHDAKLSIKRAFARHVVK